MENQLKEFPNSKNLKRVSNLKGGKPSSTIGISKDTYAFDSNMTKEIPNSEYYTLAIGKISTRFHIAINANGLQEYKNINRYNCFETRMSCIFMEDPISEQSIPYENISKMQLLTNGLPQNQEIYQDNEKERERKNKSLAHRFGEIKSKIHNNILDFYQTITCDDVEEEIVEGLKAGFIPTEDLKLDYIAGLV